MLVTDKIKNTVLTPVEQNIAEYMMEHIDDLKKLSTRDLARLTFTSSSAVIRLAHKLGYQGYNELKAQIIAEKHYLDLHFEQLDPNIPFQLDDSMMKVAHVISELMAESAKDTFALLDHDALQQAAGILYRAHHIYVFGFGAYVSLAKVFQLKMSRIRQYVIVQDFVGEENYQADMLSQDDCAIFISYTGENFYLNHIAQALKEKEIPIIGITSIGENSLSSVCHCCLHMTTREKIFSKIASYTTEYSVELILDILYSLCFKQNYASNLKYKIDHSKKVEISHFSHNEIIKE